MGDRCNIALTVRKSDVGRWDHIFGGENWDFCSQDNPDNPELMDAEVEEINYGGNPEVEAAVQAGLVFVGNHSSGACYPAGRFASDGKHAYYWELDHGGDFTVKVVTGKVSKPELTKLRAFRQNYNRVCKSLKLKARV